MAVSLVVGKVLVDDPLGLKEPKENGEVCDSECKAKCAITSERLAFLKKLVDDAVRDHRVFTIRGGWQTLRRAFLKRNWIEKFDMTSKVQKPQNCSSTADELCSNLPSRQTWESASAHTAKCERTIMSRLLQVYDVDFYWNTRKDQHDVHLRMNCHKQINRFSRSLFTSKEGLCLLLQQMYWHNEPGIANVNFPRCYVLGFPDHFNNFVDDFRLSACMGLLKYVMRKLETEDHYAVQSPEGAVPYSCLRFAMDRLNEYLCFRKHLDIDVEIPNIEAKEWEDFLLHFREIVHDGKLFLESKEYNLQNMCSASKVIMKKLASYWPQIELDGMKNIWIMKPGNKCRGRGIQLIKDVKDVAKVMEMKLKYVVQKYIERPLIIYKTKFDIRQWFLITSVQPLVIWMYKECYLRFSSQNFSLDNFHESLHLTNHAVQCKYKNTTSRDKALPDENMWDCHMFKEYLKGIGQENKYDCIVFPGMKESIIGSMLACQDTMDRRPNTFELYGADFILAEDFKPWLLEINSSPDLSSSTGVTARMCPQCLEDLVKVVIDKKREPLSDTGLFECIFKQNLPRAPAYFGMSLSVRGRRIFKRHRVKKDKENENGSLKNKTSTKITRLTTPELMNQSIDSKLQTAAMAKRYSGPVIADLMDEIHKSVQNDSDCEMGVEVASPVKQIAKKRISKLENRVAKVVSHRVNINKPASSPSKKRNPAISVASKTQPTPERLKSNQKRGRVTFGSVNEWTDINYKETWARHTTVSILRGKGGDKVQFNKIHTPIPDIVSHSAIPPILRRSFNFVNSQDSTNLLTVGYGLGIKHINRPHT